MRSAIVPPVRETTFSDSIPAFLWWFSCDFLVELSCKQPAKWLRLSPRNCTGCKNVWNNFYYADPIFSFPDCCFLCKWSQNSNNIALLLKCLNWELNQSILYPFLQMIDAWVIATSGPNFPFSWLQLILHEQTTDYSRSWQLNHLREKIIRLLVEYETTEGWLVTKLRH